jgi:hypothetical protein
VAEWLRNGLQNRVHQFNSGRGLHEINDLAVHFVTFKIHVGETSVLSPMSQEHVQDLGIARSTLVKARRDLAKSLASGYQRGKTEGAINHRRDTAGDRGN